MNNKLIDDLALALEYGVKPMKGRARKEAFELRAHMAASMARGMPPTEYDYVVAKVDMLLAELLK